MGDAADALARIRADEDLGDFCASLGIDLLVLFGSAVTHPADAHDVDLAYSGRPTAPRLDVVNAFLHRFGDAVDLMPLADAGPVAAWEALGKGRILHEAVPGTFAMAQMTAYGIFQDTREFRRLALEVLSR